MGVNLRTLGALADNASVSLIGSVDDDGFPNLKAMLPPRGRVGLITWYFTTNTSSSRVFQYRKNPKASLYFYNERFFQGVLFLGTMKVLEDKSAKTKIWRTGDEMYYPAGVEDPDYCVLEFTAQKARYYTNFSSQTLTKLE